MSSENKTPDTKTIVSLLDRASDGTFALTILNAAVAADLFLTWTVGNNLLTFDWVIGGEGLSIGLVIVFAVVYLLLSTIGSAVLVRLFRFVERFFPERDTVNPGPDGDSVTDRDLEEHALAEQSSFLLGLVYKAREEAEAKVRSHQHLLSITALAWPLLFAEMYLSGTVVNGAPLLVQLPIGLLAVGIFMLFANMLAFDQQRLTKVFYPPLARVQRQRWREQKHM